MGTWQRPGTPIEAPSSRWQRPLRRSPRCRAGLSLSDVAEVDLNVVCKNCGSEVSPYITECPYCGQRLRKRAPKLTPGGRGRVELAPAPQAAQAAAAARRKRRRARGAPARLAVGPAALRDDRARARQRRRCCIAERASSLGLYDLGAVIGPLDGDWWRLVAAQFVYENVGYLFAVGVAVAIFGTSLERRYGAARDRCDLPRLPARPGMYLATRGRGLPVAIGGNGSALGLLCAWLVRDLRDRRAGYDTESDLLGVAAIAAVLVAMPLLETTADAWAGLGGAAVGALAGLAAAGAA